MAEQKTVLDVIIIGSGCAGYSAGLYSSRASRNVLLFTGTSDYGLLSGGQLTTTTDIENYPGVEQIGGYELVEIMKNQALKYGLNIIERTIVDVNHDSFPYIITDNKGVQYLTQSIIISTGSTAKRLYLQNENRFWNKGISACAVCDGALPRFRNKKIVVIGGGDTAMEEALFLAKYASNVYVINRSDKLRASKIMIDRVIKNNKIEIMYNKNVIDVFGDDSKGLQSVKLNDDTVLEASGLFYAIGHTPNTKFLANTKITLNDIGYIVTEGKSTKTSVDGIFACGDVQDDKYRQAIVASGTGCMSSLDAEHWLNRLN
jgi:thioredoxin reductase (NADPH)